MGSSKRRKEKKMPIKFAHCFRRRMEHLRYFYEILSSIFFPYFLVTRISHWPYRKLCIPCRYFFYPRALEEARGRVISGKGRGRGIEKRTIEITEEGELYLSHFRKRKKVLTRRQYFSERRAIARYPVSSALRR